MKTWLEYYNEQFKWLVSSFRRGGQEPTEDQLELLASFAREWADKSIEIDRMKMQRGEAREAE